MRCEGWTRRGGAFTLGPPQWTQCENDAIVLLTVKQDDGVTEQPSCIDCWKLAVNKNIEIVSSIPI